MASLRKKPSPDADVASLDAAPPVETSVDASPPPAPAPALESESESVTSPQDDAGQALRKQIEAIRQGETQQAAAAAAALAAQERRQAWLEATPAAQQNYEALGALHHAALNAGFADTSPGYFDFLEQQLANLQRPTAVAPELVSDMQQRAAQYREPEPPPPRPAPARASIVSAPVSREIPTGDGTRTPNKIRLTAQHLEAARISGVTPEQYARQLLKLNEMRQSGEYSDRR